MDVKCRRQVNLGVHLLIFGGVMEVFWEKKKKKKKTLHPPLRLKKKKKKKKKKNTPPIIEAKKIHLPEK